MLFNIKKLVSLLAVLGIFMLSGYTQTTYAVASLKDGDFFQAYNNTVHVGTWTDPISAKPGDIVEFRVMMFNEGDEVATDVQVWGTENGLLPQDPALQHKVTARMHNTNFGGKNVTDIVTINVTGGVPTGLRYLPGHVRLNGVTDLFNCPNTCDVDDTKYSPIAGFEVGDIQPGDFVEVAFKAVLNPVSTASPTATPTATPTASPTATPTATPTASPTATPTATPAVIGVTDGPDELPKTGLPLAGLALAGLLPAGAALRKLGRKSKDSETANSLWEQRQFRK